MASAPGRRAGVSGSARIVPHIAAACALALTELVLSAALPFAYASVESSSENNGRIYEGGTMFSVTREPAGAQPQSDDSQPARPSATNVTPNGDDKSSVQPAYTSDPNDDEKEDAHQSMLASPVKTGDMRGAIICLLGAMAAALAIVGIAETFRSQG